MKIEVITLGTIDENVDPSIIAEMKAKLNPAMNRKFKIESPEEASTRNHALEKLMRAKHLSK